VSIQELATVSIGEHTSCTRVHGRQQPRRPLPPGVAAIVCEGNKGPATSPCSPGALMVSPLLLPPSLLRCLGQGKSCYAGASPFLGQNWAFVTAGSALWRSSPSCVRVRHENFGVLTLFLVSMVMSTPIFFYCTILPLLFENEDNVYPYFTVSWMP